MPDKRYWHYLKPVKGCGLPGKVYVLAVSGVQVADLSQPETASLKLTSWTLVNVGANTDALAESGELSGADGSTLLSALAGLCLSRGITWIFALDWVSIASQIGLWDALSSGHWELAGRHGKARPEAGVDRSATWEGVAVVDDPPFLMRIKPSVLPGQLHLVDTRNYGLHSWSQLNEYDGNRTDKDSCSCSTGTEEEQESRTRAERLRQWAVSLFATVRGKGKGGLRGTVGATAIHVYRARYLDNLILVHDNRDATAIERHSFHPGRCEAFRLGYIEGPIWETDYTSMYPSVARDALLPVRFRRIIRGKDLDYEHIKKSGHLAICVARVETYIPCVPYWRQGKSTYPVGRFTTTLCGPEIEAALSTAKSVSIRMAALYEPECIFGRCFGDWFSERIQSIKRGETFWARYYKSSMLSLIGKFAQRLQIWQDAPSDKAIAPFECWYERGQKEGELVRWRSIAGRTQYEKEPEEHPEGVPAIASWIASLARAKITQHILRIGRRDCFYCDTDSLWINNSAFDLLRPTEGIDAQFGELRKAAGPYPWIWIYGQKHLDLPGRQIHAGIPEYAERIDERTFKWSSPERFNWSVNRGLAPSNAVVEHTYRIWPKYHAGTVGEDGCIKPFIEREWDDETSILG